MCNDRRFITAYGMAHGGKSLFWQTGELLFVYVLTEACGMSPRQTGLVLAMSLLLSAGLDLLAGRLLGNRVLTVRSAATVQWWGTLASAITFTAFGFTGFMAGDERLAFVVGSLILFRLAYAFLDNSQNAMLVLAAEGDAGRARIASVRYMSGGVASIGVAGAVAPLLKARNHPSFVAQFAEFALAVSVLAIVSALFLLIISRWSKDARPTCRPDPPSASVVLEKRPSRASRTRLLIFLCMFVVSAGMSIFGRVEPYFVAYTFKYNGAALMICIAAGTAVSQPMWTRYAARFSLPWTLRAAAVCLVAGVLAFEQSANINPLAAAVSALAYGWGCGGVLMSLWALAASTADFSSRSTGATGTVGRLTSSAKMGLAAAAFVTGEILSNADYRSGMSPADFHLMTLAPAMGGMACLAISLFLTSRDEGAECLTSVEPKTRDEAVADRARKLPFT